MEPNNFIDNLRLHISRIKYKIALSVLNYLFLASAIAFYLIAPNLKPQLVSTISISMIVAITLFCIISAFLYPKLPLEENEKKRNIAHAFLTACAFELLFSCFSSSISLAALSTVVIIAVLLISKTPNAMYPSVNNDGIERNGVCKGILLCIYAILFFSKDICSALIKPKLEWTKITIITMLGLLITAALTIDIVICLSFKGYLNETLDKTNNKLGAFDNAGKGRSLRDAADLEDFVTLQGEASAIL